MWPFSEFYSLHSHYWFSLRQNGNIPCRNKCLLKVEKSTKWGCKKVIGRVFSGMDSRFLWHCLWTMWFWNNSPWVTLHTLKNVWSATACPLFRLVTLKMFYDADGEIKESITVLKSHLFFPNRHFPLWGCIKQVNWIAAEVLVKLFFDTFCEQ